LVESLTFKSADEAKRSEAKRRDVLELERSNAMLEQLLEVSNLAGVPAATGFGCNWPRLELALAGTAAYASTRASSVSFWGGLWLGL
jgi:hypothetical protein